MKNRKYTLEFKEEAVKLVTEQGYSQSEAGKNLGVSSKNINRWVGEFSGKGCGLKDKKFFSTDENELLQLRKENKRLKLEREILKKATAFFAREHD